MSETQMAVVEMFVKVSVSEYTRWQVAEILGRSNSYVDKLSASGMLAKQKNGRYKRSEVVRYLMENRK